MLIPVAAILQAPTLVADEFDDCVDGKIKEFKNIQSFSREGSVRCEGAGVGGSGHSKNGVVTFSAAPGYQIVGNIEIDNLSQNRGNYGQASYETDDTGKVVKVSVPISCSSPSQMFGPGAWMNIRIRGRVELPPTEQELKSIFKSCAHKL